MDLIDEEIIIKFIIIPTITIIEETLQFYLGDQKKPQNNWRDLKYNLYVFLGLGWATKSLCEGYKTGETEPFSAF